MRILLVKTKTGLYYESFDSWTNEPQMAKAFPNSREAAVFAREMCDDELEVFLDFDDEEYNVSLPVQDRLQYP